LYGKSYEETKEIIEFVKDFSELGNYFDMPIKTYSSGMKGRLSFGLSLAFDFDYMLIDETLSVGDARFRVKAQAALRKKIESCHVLLVSHDMKTLSDICQAGLLVHEGQLHYYEDINDGIERYNEINKTRGKK
jgi:capsular polysaccharide transport system ATP-binding protein